MWNVYKQNVSSDPHTHAWPFISHILCGQLDVTVFKQIEGDGFVEIRQSRTDGGVNHALTGKAVSLHKVLSSRMCTGDVYMQRAGRIHDVNCVSSDICATIMVQGRPHLYDSSMLYRTQTESIRPICRPTYPSTNLRWVLKTILERIDERRAW